MKVISQFSIMLEDYIGMTIEICPVTSSTFPKIFQGYIFGDIHQYGALLLFVSDRVQSSLSKNSSV